MPLMSFGKCWRGRTDCYALDTVEAPPDDITQEQFETMDFTPKSFVCCGSVDPAARTLPQDAFRLCFKNQCSDEMTDNDIQDLAHIQHVIATSMAIYATRIVNSGSVEVLDHAEDGPEGLLRVETKQKA